MTDVDIDQARYNMIEQQIRTWEVLDTEVLDIIATTPRERFVPREYRNLAFTDVEIPIGNGQTMMEPKLEARILQILKIRPGDRILEIGTGSGYLTACLAQMGNEVVTVELYPELSQHAQQQIAGLGIENVQYRIGDAGKDWSQDGDFDVIVLTGSLPVMQDSFKQRLKTGGRMFAVVGDGLLMEALLVTRQSAQEWNTESLFEIHLPPLLNAATPQAFVF